MQKYQAKEPKENKPARPVSAVVRNKQPDVKAAGRPVSANDANRAPLAAQPANLALDAAKQGAMERYVCVKCYLSWLKERKGKTISEKFKILSS